MKGREMQMVEEERKIKYEITTCLLSRRERGGYKALTGLSLLWVPHFRARCGASLKDFNPDTTSTSNAKCFPISR